MEVDLGGGFDSKLINNFFLLFYNQHTKPVELRAWWDGGGGGEGGGGGGGVEEGEEGGNRSTFKPQRIIASLDLLLNCFCACIKITLSILIDL